MVDWIGKYSWSGWCCLSQRYLKVLESSLRMFMRFRFPILKLWWSCFYIFMPRNFYRRGKAATGFGNYIYVYLYHHNQIIWSSMHTHIVVNISPLYLYSQLIHVYQSTLYLPYSISSSPKILLALTCLSYSIELQKLQ